MSCLLFLKRNRKGREERRRKKKPQINPLNEKQLKTVLLYIYYGLISYFSTMHLVTSSMMKSFTMSWKSFPSSNGSDRRKLCANINSRSWIRSPISGGNDLNKITLICLLKRIIITFVLFYTKSLATRRNDWRLDEKGLTIWNFLFHPFLRYSRKLRNDYLWNKLPPVLKQMLSDQIRLVAGIFWGIICLFVTNCVI